ncbi:hypothetical protein [Microbacterium aurantiacum]|uniref:hypothetical protein n=1 Tax=Microbacterium aurantiacum TaxID=162393 RepID=UPI000C806E3B|nr:hypothetical protein [Microbacterium aurantiacum]
MSASTLQQHVDELRTAIAASSPGHETLWEHHCVQVTVYGQARYALEQPTPWAVIKLNGRQRAFFTWEQVVEAAEQIARQKS